MPVRPSIPDEPPPVPNAGVPVWNLVIKDMGERDQLGRERYGTPLQTNNGRDHLVDAYQEGLDLVVYLRAKIEELKTQPVPIDEEALAIELYRRGYLGARFASNMTDYCRQVAAEMFKAMREEMTTNGR